MSDPAPNSTSAATPEGALRSFALHTDHYELTMLDAALRSGVAERRAVFEMFTRSLPPGRRYGVVAGTGRLLDALEGFRFTDDDLTWLRERAFLSPAALDRLADLRFTGHVDGYAEGDLFFPSSPVLTVEAPFIEALVLETLVLSIYNFDSAVAAAGSRMVMAAAGRPLIEGGSRRTHEEAAVASARAAWLAGFDVTSNLEASRRYRIPSAGTVAHAFTLAHADERTAFAAQVAAFGPATTFLVDTFDVERGIRRAVEAAGSELGGIRLDSGDLAIDARRARELLDDLGAPRARITASGDLDEFSIAALGESPVDQYMVGTALVTGSGAATAGMVYKLVAIADAEGPEAPLRAVAKRSAGKATTGGRKLAYRVLDHDGFMVAEFVTTEPADRPAPPVEARALQQPLIRSGNRVCHEPLETARSRHRDALGELRPEHRGIEAGRPAFVAGPDAAWAEPPSARAGHPRGSR